MNPTITLAYVEAAAQLLELPMDAARIQAVAGHFERTAAMARVLEQALPLSAHDEPASLYCPAPFPTGEIE